MNDSKALCPQCKNEVRFQREGRIARCPGCGFQYELSQPPYPGSPQPAADRTENPFLQFLKIVAFALLVLMGLGALLLGILFVGCATMFRGF